MLITLLPPVVASAAGARVTITNLFKATTALVNGKPSVLEDNNIFRFTVNPITIIASIDGISSAEVPNLYYVITNMNTGIVTTEKSNKAKVDSTFDIRFTNVNLTEGLNKVVISLDGSSSLESEPNWAYFVPTTTIQDLVVDQLLFDENKIYPLNPALLSSVAISGKAPNASSVTAQIYGDDSPKSLFISNGTFQLSGDDKNKTTNPDFKLSPGDNLFTFSASNNSKSYQVDKNLIYDNGKPFAFGAKIQGIVNDELILAAVAGTKDYFNQEGLITNSLVVYKGSNKTSTLLIPVTDYAFGQELPSAGVNAGKYYITFTASGVAKALPALAGQAPTTYVYASYRTGDKKLITTPTVTTSSVRIDALIKSDITVLNAVVYKYVDVKIGSQTFGPYDLSSAEAAPAVNAHFPTTIHLDYSSTELSIVGVALNEPGILINIEGPNGSNPLLTADLGAPTHSGSTFATYEIPSGRLNATSPAGGTYTFFVKRTDGTLINQFTIPVTDPTAVVPPTVDTLAAGGFQTQIISLQEGYNAAARTQRIYFDAEPTPLSVKTSVEIFDINGQSRGTGSNLLADLTGQDYVQFDLPLTLTQGDYKFKVMYDNHALTERHFSIAAPTPAAPALTIPAVAQITVPDYSTVTYDTDPTVGISMSVIPIANAPSYVRITGTNFGTDLAAITVARLIKGASIITLTPYAVENTYAIFKIADQSALTNGLAYNLELTIDGTVLAAVTDAYMSEVRTTAATAASITPSVYSGQVITTDLTINGTLGNQLTTTEAAALATTLVVSGVNLVQTKLSAKVVREDGTVLVLPTPNIVVSVPGVGGIQTATVTLPAGLTEGNFILQFFDNDLSNPPIFLTQFPFTIVNPTFSSITPINVPVSNLPEPITVTGNFLGRIVSLLEFRFTSKATNLVVDQVTATSITAGSQAVFNAPAGLTKGAYTVTMLYNSIPLSNPQEFTIASEPAKLKKNLFWSKPGKFKVFDFSVDLPIPSEKSQLVQFKFYNTVTDNIPPTTFTFNYIDPNLPYVDRVTRKTSTSDTTGTLISDKTVTEISEQPSTLFIYTDTKAVKLNVYLGDTFNSSSVPYKTFIGATAALNDGYVVVGTNHQFTLNLDGVPNGTKKLTIVPSLDATASPPNVKSGENLIGLKKYDLVFSSTPYVIATNVFSGMVIKAETEIGCTAVLTGCISGRLINVPGLDVLGNVDTATSKVEFYVNDQLASLPITIDTPASDKKFKAAFSTLIEGKNTFTFKIYLKHNGVFVKTTETKFEVFKFSTSASRFGDIKPIEIGGVIKYPARIPVDSYATSETAVALSGQFINATEIKLTVKLKDTNGELIVPSPFDRRYNNFLVVEPASGNPNFFSLINTTTGQFATNTIQLSAKGDTIFEFQITNASNVKITKVITITREPRPYIVLFPKTFMNAKKLEQANINSNYVEIELEAESANKVLFGKDEAVKKEVSVNGVTKIHFFYEAKDLKSGTNTLKFTIQSGDEKKNGSLILFNANTTLTGAQFKTALKSKITAFNGLVQLSFPKGTTFMRNDSSAVDSYLSSDRKILFGLANNTDGRVDKYKNPATYDGQTGNPNPTIIADAKFLLAEPTGRFRPAGQLIWIDAGTISNSDTDLNQIINGGGRLPYDAVAFYDRILKDLVVTSQPGELKLKYDPVLRETASRFLTVYHYDIFEDSTGVVKARWRNIGGVVDPKSSTITVPLENFGYYQVMFMDNSFDDVNSHAWARNILDTLYSKGIMQPKAPPAAFSPNDPISRGEFTTMLVKIFDIPLHYTEDPTFTDVLRTDPGGTALYDYKYIETAAAAGIVRGSGGGKFQPDATIRRQDAAVMIAKAANLKMGTDDVKILKSLQKSFTDANAIDVYTLAAIEAVTKAGLITGKENTLVAGVKPTFRFDPLDTMTRAEAGAIAISILKQQKKLPK